MASSKRILTNVTAAELAAAQGGIGGDDSRLTVECPISYDVNRITAEDIAHDSQISVVDA